MLPKRLDPKHYFGTRCGMCPFARHGQAYLPVLGEGPSDAMGVLVGESPGADEVDRGRPFVGWTGKELEDLLLESRLQRAKLYLTNAICCRPPLGKSLADMKRAADCCRPALIGQLRTLEDAQGGLPHVFAMGAWAFYSLTGKRKGMKTTRGFIRDDWTLQATVAAESRERRKAAPKGGKKHGTHRKSSPHVRAAPQPVGERGLRNGPRPLRPAGARRDTRA